MAEDLCAGEQAITAQDGRKLAHQCLAFTEHQTCPVRPDAMLAAELFTGCLFGPETLPACKTACKTASAGGCCQHKLLHCAQLPYAVQDAEGFVEDMGKLFEGLDPDLISDHTSDIITKMLEEVRCACALLPYVQPKPLASGCGCIFSPESCLQARS